MRKSAVFRFVVILVSLMLGGLFFLSTHELLYTWELDNLAFRQRMFAGSVIERQSMTPLVLVGYDAKAFSSEDLETLFGNPFSKTGRPLSRQMFAYVTRFLRRTTPKAVIFDASFNGGRNRGGEEAFIENLQGASHFSSALMFETKPDPAYALEAYPPLMQEAILANTVRADGLEHFPVFRQLYTFPTLDAPFYELMTQTPMRFYSAHNVVMQANPGASVGDQSGDARRWAAFTLYGNHVFATSALGALLQGERNLQLSPNGLLSWPGGQLHLGEDGLPLIKWYGHAVNGRSLYPEYSMLDLVYSELVLECRENPGNPDCHKVPLPKEPPLSPSLFQDQYVLIGFTLPSSEDAHKTIFGQRYSGMYILANCLDNVLHDDFVLPAPWWLNALAILLLPLGMFAVALRYRSIWLSLVLAFSLCLGYFVFTAYAYNQLNLWLFAVYPMLGALLCYVGVYFYRFVQEQRQRQQLRFAFGKYVSSNIMQYIERNPDKVALGGERREMTFLFSDIRGFTKFSDQHSPEEVQAMLTQYFSAMHGIIMERYQGTLDKLIGDAIMAYWGFPMDTTDHAFLAVSAALAMKEEMQAWQNDPNRPPLNIGIGINTGDAVIGNVGSEHFMDFTVIGDSVNVASRLESMNKEFGTNIIISASTYEQVKDRIVARSLGFSAIRGKEGEMELFEPLGFVETPATPPL